MIFRATYRLQIHHKFTLNDAKNLATYLDELGISHIYLSPVFDSVRGSLHGYDGINPAKISVERGGESELYSLALKVRRLSGIQGLILDIVPNHLAASAQNPYWWDVLKHGPVSRYWQSFDFHVGSGKDRRVVLPFLSRSLPSVLAARELNLSVDPKYGFVVRHGSEIFPVNPGSYRDILEFLQRKLIELSNHGRGQKIFLNGLQDLLRARVNSKRLEQQALIWLTDDSAVLRTVEILLKLSPVKLV